MKILSEARRARRNFNLSNPGPAISIIGGVVASRGGQSFADIVRKTKPLTPEQEQKAFHLPPGFEIELVAAEPDIGKPINMAFDAQGRLWITQSREYPFPAPEERNRAMPSDFDGVLGGGRAQKNHDVRGRPEHSNRHLILIATARLATVFRIFISFHDTNGVA